MSIDFLPFPKMPRLSREIIITEKIDGTNAQVYIEEATDSYTIVRGMDDPSVIYKLELSDRVLFLRAGSRTRYITPNDGERDANGHAINKDNMGFAAWAHRNAADLMKLGPGRHFGEWWGQGIQRGYGLTEKRFSLFNVARWYDPASRPLCCHVVPILYQGDFSTEQGVAFAMDDLIQCGSAAAPGFMNPEGIIVFHTAANIGFKKTVHKDELPKSLAA